MQVVFYQSPTTPIVCSLSCFDDVRINQTGTIFYSSGYKCSLNNPIDVQGLRGTYFSGIGLYGCGILAALVLLFVGRNRKIFSSDMIGLEDEDEDDEKLPEYTEKDMQDV